MFSFGLSPKNINISFFISESARNLSNANLKSIAQQSTVTTLAKRKLRIDSTLKRTLQDSPKSTSTDTPEDRTRIWIYVGLGTVIVGVGIVVVIYQYRRKLARRIATSGTQVFELY